MSRVPEQHLLYLQERARKSGLQPDWDEFNNAAHEYNKQQACHPQGGGFTAAEVLRRQLTKAARP